MTLPEIDFGSIRPQNGSRHDGFEELCTQLALLEPRPNGSTFTRTGSGADAGVECYIERKGGTERGWQAKYVFSWDDGLGSQLNKSIEAALAKHPDLTEYVVCLPYNLPDARQEGRKSQRDKWNDWKEKWTKKAEQDGRKLTIELWDATALSKRLTFDKAAYAGRLFYWFETTELTPEWFRQSFEKTRSDLGSRYTPESNIELPIRQAFIGCSRAAGLNKAVQGWASGILDDASSVGFSFPKKPHEERNPHEEAFQSAMADLAQHLVRKPIELSERFPLDDWSAVVSIARGCAQDLLHSIYEAPPTDDKESAPDLSYARVKLVSSMDRLAAIAHELASDVWRLANADAVLLSGSAGTGKSHLLADVVDHQIYSGRPALMVLGSSMVEGDPWQQILRLLHLPPTLSVSHFLGALDAAAEASESRVLLCIDAINERHGLEIWPDHLGSFLKAAESFPRVVVVLSCRTTYLSHIVPKDIGESSLTPIEHNGFAEDGGKAASLYLTKRGVVRAGAPNLAPEMYVPLFLKSLCDALESKGEAEIPRGLRGVSALFRYYNDAVIEAVTKKLGLDQNLDLVGQAIDQLANLLAKRGDAYAPYGEVSTLFEAILPSNGSRERGLLPQLENEGILTVESFDDENGGFTREVRFTFERYADHIIAHSLLEKHLNSSDIVGSFATDTVLGELAFSSGQHSKAGIVEAIAIQLPELCGAEIIDLGRENNWTVSRAFEESLLWRKQEYFAPRTMELVTDHLSKDDYYALLVQIATEPDNRYNSDFLDQILRPHSMPARDADWSAWLMHQGEPDDAVMTLINWALRNGSDYISAARAELAAIALSWLLTGSNREIRDKATKALASLFATRLELASKLLRRFADVDDLYILERLLAATYGAVLQGRVPSRLEQLSETVFEVVFASGSPPLNELLRDHARCILQFADHLEVLPSKISVAEYMPPYSSPWPIEHVTDEQIESYKQDYDGAYVRDDIVASSVSDGDFARYEIDPFVRHWGVAAPDDLSPLTYDEQAKVWLDEFEAKATDAQAVVLALVMSATQKLEGQSSYGSSPEHTALKEANEQFKAVCDDIDWEDYRVRAKNHISVGMFSKERVARRNAARFDSGWARRWICKRAHDFGWTSDRFSKLEPRSSYSRTDHQVERIGKKYQWLALHELAARMADNLTHFGKTYGDDAAPYTGIRNLRLRDMDPSLLLTETFYDSWGEWPKSWWVPFEPKLGPATPSERIGWLRSDADVPRNTDLISLTDPKSGKDWLPLNLHAGWIHSGYEGDSKGMLRQVWFRINCFLVKLSDEKKLLESLEDRSLIGSHDMPDFEFDSEFHLGEYPWHPDVLAEDYWSETGGRLDLPVPIRPTAFEMLRERSGHDYSIDKSVNLALPTPWLVDALQVRLRSGQDPVFVNSDEETVVFDPSVSTPGHQAALVEKPAFLEMLDRNDLSAFWVLAGEKGVYGGPSSSSGHGGRIDHTTIYWLKDGEIVQHHEHSDEQPPSKEQLLKFLELDTVPPWLSDWTGRD